MSEATNNKKIVKANRREERALQEQKEKKKVRIIALVVVIVFALLLAGALILNSKFIRRTMTAITIGGVDFTAAEFDFFFNNANRDYQTYINNNYGDYASGMLPSTDKALASQIYNEETGETWADFFTSYAIEQVSELVKYYNAAEAAGYAMTDEMRQSIDEEIELYKQYSELLGYPSFDEYIQAYYGISMNEKSFRNVMEFVNLASGYATYISDSLTYSDSELAEYYDENRDSLDSFTFRYFLLSADTVLEEDYETEEEYEAAKDAALEDSYERAAAIADGIESEEDFIAAAREANESSYSDYDSTLRVYPGSWLGDTYGPWLREADRQPGDCTSIGMTTGGYLVYFIDRDPNQYRMVEMRQILVQRQELDPSEFEEGKDDPAYLQAFDIVDDVARGQAEEALRLFEEDGASEDALIALMEEYSSDETEGGFYDLVTKNAANNKMAKEIEDWLFEEGRQVGDYKLIRTADYGYHLVYFVGFDDMYCDYLAREKMHETDYQAWLDGLPPVDSARKWAFRFTTN
ncbi:MAG: hypothetical protein FWH33_04350 [Oscillospiraceae bacterium]|nr:hypothetical protein [Oscillospiraceae bacterium]